LAERAFPIVLGVCLQHIRSDGKTFKELILAQKRKEFVVSKSAQSVVEDEIQFAIG
jgi:hypothetical protein